MSEDQFTKLFVYMQKHFGVIETQLENMATKDDIRQVYSILDEHREILDRVELKLAAMSNQASDHETWIEKAAPRVGVPYQRTA